METSRICRYKDGIHWHDGDTEKSKENHRRLRGHPCTCVYIYTHGSYICILIYMCIFYRYIEVAEPRFEHMFLTTALVNESGRRY